MSREKKLGGRNGPPFLMDLKNEEKGIEPMILFIIAYRGIGNKKVISNKQRQPQAVWDGVGVGKIAPSTALHWWKTHTGEFWERCECVLCLGSGGTGTFWAEGAAAAKSRI